MLKIALVSPFTLPSLCGNSILTERIRAGLRLRGLDVRVFNASTDDPQTAVAFAPDLIHSIHTLRPAKWLDRFFSACDAPLCITLTGTDYNNLEDPHASHEIIHQYWHKAAALIVFHQHAYNQITARAPLTAAKLRVIPQGIETPSGLPDRASIRNKFNLPQEACIVFMAAGIRPVKNIRLALSAFKQLKNKHADIHLVHAGTDLDPEETKHIYAAGGNLRSFHTLGPRKHAETMQLMTAADIFLNTSLQEGMSGAILEAMAAGLPVIATDIPGNTTLVKNRHNGLLVSTNNPQELAAAVIALAGNPEQRTAYGATGQKIARTKFDPKREIGRYEEIYLTILNSKL